MTAPRPSAKDLASTRPPPYRIMRSVWSLEAAGSTTVQATSGPQPRQQHTGLDLCGRHRHGMVIARSVRPGWRSAAGCRPTRPDTCAPIAPSGSMMRAIGRRRMLASPVRMQKNGNEASSPGRRRMRVPELATSMTSSGSREAVPASTVDHESVFRFLDCDAQGPAPLPQWPECRPSGETRSRAGVRR